jgi:hypothetical protein
MLCCVVWYILTDVSEVLSASIIRVMSSTSTKMAVFRDVAPCTGLHGAPSQKTVIFILVAVRSWNRYNIDFRERGLSPKADVLHKKRILFNFGGSWLYEVQSSCLCYLNPALLRMYVHTHTQVYIYACITYTHTYNLHTEWSKSHCAVGRNKLFIFISWIHIQLIDPNGWNKNKNFVFS